MLVFIAHRKRLVGNSGRAASLTEVYHTHSVLEARYGRRLLGSRQEERSLYLLPGSRQRCPDNVMMREKQDDVAS